MRREKGMNKSHTRLHLLLENSKQKQALSTRTKGNVLQGCSLSMLLFSLQSRGKRGSEICHLLHTPRSAWQEHKAGCSSPGGPGLWGCVTEVTPSHRHGSPSKEGNSTSPTIYRALKQLLCVSPPAWQNSGISEEPSQAALECRAVS